MAKFVYRMQNILELTEKLEAQEKINFGIAQQAVNDEQDKLKELLAKRTGAAKGSEESGTCQKEAG